MSFTNHTEVYIVAAAITGCFATFCLLSIAALWRLGARGGAAAALRPQQQSSHPHDATRDHDRAVRIPAALAESPCVEDVSLLGRAKEEFQSSYSQHSDQQIKIAGTTVERELDGHSVVSRGSEEDRAFSVSRRMTRVQHHTGERQPLLQDSGRQHYSSGASGRLYCPRTAAHNLYRLVSRRRRQDEKNHGKSGVIGLGFADDHDFEAKVLLNDSRSPAGTMPQNNYSNWAAEPLTTEQFTAYMSRFALYYVFIGLGVFAAAFMQTVCWELACERQIFRLRHLFFAQVLRQDVTWFDQNQSGDLTIKLSE
ncbi:hypothetical protein B566_EDAN005038 [Ephemera danica]|nr:hypothetical protein B566_EDAN005038 [Ephemera danica]